MIKKIIAIIILSILLFILYPYAKKNEVIPEVETINFIQEGYLNFDSTGNRQDTPYLLYKTDLLAPTTTVKLIIDESSMCVTVNGSIPCYAMSILWHIPFGGKRALVEAYDSDGEIRVMALRIMDESGNVPFATE
ncbi:MAG: hypothetical protein ACYCY6_02265 [Minisyncoccota bacterium]